MVAHFHHAISDLANIIKTFVGKLEPYDQAEILELLRNIRRYLDRGHVSSEEVDEPVVVLVKLIITIQGMTNSDTANATPLYEGSKGFNRKNAFHSSISNLSSGSELSHALPFQVARIDRKLQKISQEPQDRGTLAHRKESTFASPGIAKVRCKVCSERYTNAMECAIHVYNVHEITIVCDSCGKDFKPGNPESRGAGRIYCSCCALLHPPEEPLEQLADLNPDIEILVIEESKVSDSEVKVFTKVSTTKDQAQQLDVSNQMAFSEESTSTNDLKITALSSYSKPAICQICNQNFSSEEKLENHLKVHMESNKTYRGYMKHVAKHSSDVKEHICKICNKKFTKDAGLKYHIQVMHFTGKTFDCTFCEKKFRSRNMKNRHIFLYHKNYIYRCSLCDYSPRSGDQLKSHLQIYHPEVVWTRPEDYRHVADVPYSEDMKARKGKRGPRVPFVPIPGRKLYTCDLCNMSYRTFNSLHKHYKTVTHLKKEAESKGAEPRVFPCDMCERTFNSPGTLNRHIRTYHKGAPRFQCNGCKNSYLSSVALKDHMASHTGENPFHTCQKCNATFHTGLCLWKHIQTQHLGKG